MPDLDPLNSGAPFTPVPSSAPLVGIGLAGATRAPLLCDYIADFATFDTINFGGYNPGVVDLVGGQLQITPSNAYPGFFINGLGDLTGNGVFVDVPQVTNNGLGTTSTYLKLVADNGPGGEKNQFIIEKFGDGLLYLYQYRNNVYNEFGPITYDPVAHRWWRITEDNGTVTYWTAPDGLTWTSRATSGLPGFPIHGLYILLQAGFSGAETTPGLAVFDNLNLAPTPADVTLPATLVGPVRPFALSAPAALILRSTDEPPAVVDVPPRPLVVTVQAPRILAPAGYASSSDLEAGTDVPPVISVEVAPRAAIAVAPSSVVLRSTADPVVVVETLPSVVVARTSSAARPAAPAILARSTSDPAEVRPGAQAPRSAPPVALAPVAPAVVRSTADPVVVVDAIPQLVTGRAPFAAPAPAPAALVEFSRDVTPLQPSANPAQALVAPVGRTPATAAPAPAVARSTADPAPTDTPQRVTIATAALEVARPAPRAVVLGAEVEDASPVGPRVVVVRVASAAALAPAVQLERSTADPVVVDESGPRVLVARAPLALPAAAAPVVERSTADPAAVDESTPRIVQPRALEWTRSTAPAALVVHPAAPADEVLPELALVARAFAVATYAPRPVVMRSAADPVIAPPRPITLAQLVGRVVAVRAYLARAAFDPVAASATVGVLTSGAAVGPWFGSSATTSGLTSGAAVGPSGVAVSTASPLTSGSPSGPSLTTGG